MAGSKKIAISLPEALAGKIERSRRQTGDTRSAFIRRAVERWFSEREEQARIAAYVEGYRAHPESAEEVDAAEAAAVALLGACSEIENSSLSYPLSPALRGEG